MDPVKLVKGDGVPDEPSLGELSRLILRVETGLREDISEIRQDIRSLQYVDKSVFDEARRSQEKEIEDLKRRQERNEEYSRRVRITAIGAFVAPFILYLVSLLLSGGPT